ncbi:MAG: haloalkane dehalogenase [Nocardioides sp.]|nr:haloalkane dehalogenase [Nocardioides sp.]
MQVLRTPESRFAHLPGYDHAPSYVDLGEVRMAYVDAGPRDAPVALLLHGEPTWGFLHRHMVGPLLEAGMRVVVPDLIGFGRSDKPARVADYTYARHVGWVTRFLDALGLDGGPDTTLFCQDWGSLIGLRIAGTEPHRFARICVGNGYLPAGQQAANLPFRAWRAFARWSPVLPVSRIVQVGTVTTLSRDVLAAYDAPYPTRRHLAGARAFPMLVPTSASDPAMPEQKRAWEGLGSYDRPFLTLFGRHDPILGGADKPLRAHVPGAEGQPHDRLRGSHFVQEDCGEEIATRMGEWVRATS